MNFLLGLGCLIFSSFAFGIDQLPVSLDAFVEEEALGPRGEAKLYVLPDSAIGKPPLVLVHGLGGRPSELSSMVELFREKFEIHVLAFDDWGRRTLLNAQDFASELLGLAGRDVTIIAHSMGGVLSREALNVLGPRLENFKRLRLYTLDTPWHGYSGPADNGFGRLLIWFGRRFIPDGLEDMRARSSFFKRLHRYPLPPHVSIHLAFAQDGPEIQDFSEPKMKGLLKALQRHYGKGRKLRLSSKEKNLWNSMKEAVNAHGVEAELMEESDIDSVRRILVSRFPRFPGDHLSVLEGPYLNFLAHEL